jgi:hypothetical protein
MISLVFVSTGDDHLDALANGIFMISIEEILEVV